MEEAETFRDEDAFVGDIKRLIGLEEDGFDGEAGPRCGYGLRAVRTWLYDQHIDHKRTRMDGPFSASC